MSLIDITDQDERSLVSDETVVSAQELEDTSPIPTEGPAPSEEPYTPPQRRLVIGIDYGTTYTGVAYATPLDATCELDKISIVSNWGPQMGNSSKVPSVITYTLRSPDGEQRWGSSLPPNAVAMVHTKLELEVCSVSEELEFLRRALEGMHDLQFQRIKEAKGSPDYPDKTADQIVTDYLSKVFMYLLKELGKFPEALRDRISTDIVITVPTGWSYRAKNSVFRALTRAGCNRYEFPRLDDVIFVSEPEAAAIYTARYLKTKTRNDFLKPLECFVLVDAGGGTVDVVSYRVLRLEPSLELELVGIPTGRKCGSIYIDEAFKDWLRRLLGDTYYRELDPNTNFKSVSAHTTESPAMRELMKKFDTLKKQFRNDGQDLALDLPGKLENLKLNGKVNDGEVIIKNGVMKSFFDRCVNQVIELIDGHLDQIDRADAHAKNIFMVGGFGESVYLRNQIKMACFQRDIYLRRPDTSWTAVARGAVICGIEKSTQNLARAKPCPRNYGLKVNQSLSEFEHKHPDIQVDPHTGRRMAVGQLVWLIRKGDLILSGLERKVLYELTLAFSKTERRNGELAIYSYAEDTHLPEKFRNRKTELECSGILRYNIDNDALTDSDWVSKGKNEGYYEVKLLLTLIMSENDFIAEITCKGKVISRCSIVD